MINLKLFLALALFLLCVQAPGICDPRSAPDYFNQATTQYLVGDLKDALKSVRNALKIDPAYTGAAKLEKSILRELGLKAPSGKPKAEKALDKANLIETYLINGKTFFNQGDYLQAAFYFRSVILLAPDNKEALVYIFKVEDRLKQDKMGMIWAYRFAFSGMVLLFLLLFLTLSVSAISVKRWAADKVGLKKTENICFNCKRKIPFNIDLCPYCGAMVGLKMWQSISDEQKLWWKKIGWTRNPFTLDIHPELFTGYGNEVKDILGKINSHSGHVLIVGPLGIGKTTLLRWLAGHLPKNDYHAVYIARPPQDFNQFVRHIYESIGVPYDQAIKEADLYNLDKLRRKINKHFVLLLDEAHEFTIDVERPLRTLGDIDGVNLVMAGLPETVDKLKNEIRPLYERLVLKVVLEHLELEEFKELIKVRIESAGGQGIHPFSAGAIEKIFAISGGNPRVSLKICDEAVARAIKMGEDRIDERMLDKIEFQSADVLAKGEVIK